LEGWLLVALLDELLRRLLKLLRSDLGLLLLLLL
jgi:hypothetical protein